MNKQTKQIKEPRLNLKYATNGNFKSVLRFPAEVNMIQVKREREKTDQNIDVLQGNWALDIST